MPKQTIIVGGLIGLLPAGGVTWDYLQFPLGFSLLGHEVYYIEDTRLYPIYQKAGSDWNDASSCVEHLMQVMKHFGFEDRWAYRDEASGQCFGLPEKKIKAICAVADVFVNVSCSTFLRDEYRSIPVRILIDSDPMFTQIQYQTKQLFTPGQPGIGDLIDGHNFHFSFGENINAVDCRVPKGTIQWQTTRQPICLDYWQPAELPLGKGAAFTTLMNWSAGKKLFYQNEEWGQKEVEFEKIKNLPQQVPGVKLSVGIAQTGDTKHFQKGALESLGWHVVNPEKVAGDWTAYKNFIQASLGEFSVAKETYVKAKTGWFSCRSACYLAAARPVVVQETGWSKSICSGKGAIAFSDLESAAEALKRVVKDLKQHSLWARSLAEECFDSHKVLNSLLERTH